MKKVVIAILLICSALFIFFAGQDKPTSQAEKWEITVTDYSNRCKSIGMDFSGTHDFIIQIQDDNKRVIYDSGTGITYYGKIDSENPKITHYTANYREDAGVLSEEITFKREDETHGSGRSVWYWSDGIMSCGGEYRFSGTRKED